MGLRDDQHNFNIKEVIDDLRKFTKYGHNFLMRYPDSFGQRRKKLGLDHVYNILKSQLSVTITLRDRAILRIFLIWQYHKK